MSTSIPSKDYRTTTDNLRDRSSREAKAHGGNVQKGSEAAAIQVNKPTYPPYSFPLPPSF